MIDAVIDGGWKSILTAIVLIVMSVLSFSSLIAELLRLKREMGANPIKGGSGGGVWAAVEQDHHKLSTAGFRGHELLKRLTAHSEGISMGGKSHATILASIGANAPYIGLFGTVVGIYGALHALGIGSAISANAIASSVGEALVMTALGLLVAIPAVFGFNYVLTLRARLRAMIEAYCVYLVSGTISGAHGRVLQQEKKRRKLI